MPDRPPRARRLAPLAAALLALAAACGGSDAAVEDSASSSGFGPAVPDTAASAAADSMAQGGPLTDSLDHATHGDTTRDTMPR